MPRRAALCTCYDMKSLAMHPLQFRWQRVGATPADVAFNKDSWIWHGLNFPGQLPAEIELSPLTSKPPPSGFS